MCSFPVHNSKIPLENAFRLSTNKLSYSCSCFSSFPEAQILHTSVLLAWLLYPRFRVRFSDAELLFSSDKGKDLCVRAPGCFKYSGFEYGKISSISRSSENILISF